MLKFLTSFSTNQFSIHIYILLGSYLAVTYAKPSIIPESDADYKETWEAWKQKHDKVYESVPEEIHRFGIWMENLKRIALSNLKYELGLTTFKLRANSLADLTKDEYRTIYLSGRPVDKQTRQVHRPTTPFVRVEERVDWRTKGAVTGVKDQGEVGASWAFSATGSTESQYFLKGHPLTNFSEQQLVDCVKNCPGGCWIDSAFEYMETTPIESDYPFNASACKFDPSKGITTISSYTDIVEGNENDLKSGVFSIGPVSVSVDASHASFQLYSSGIYYESNCSSTKLNHALLTVGYGSVGRGGEDFWIVKNSWGKFWGQEGYIQMSRNKNNNCGIASRASYPQI